MSDLIPLGSMVEVRDTITSSRAVVPITNPTGLVDPSAISVEVEDPAGVKSSFLPDRVSLGVYQVTLTLMRHGPWTVRFKAEGPGQGANLVTVLNVERTTSSDDLG